MGFNISPLLQGLSFKDAGHDIKLAKAKHDEQKENPYEEDNWILKLVIFQMHKIEQNQGGFDRGHEHGHKSVH
jgi:hypothetical protein